jgi:homoserine dehydrogenase
MSRAKIPVLVTAVGGGGVGEQILKALEQKEKELMKEFKKKFKGIDNKLNEFDIDIDK